MGVYLRHMLFKDIIGQEAADKSLMKLFLTENAGEHTGQITTPDADGN